MESSVHYINFLVYTVWCLKVLKVILALLYYHIEENQLNVGERNKKKEKKEMRTRSVGEQLVPCGFPELH